MTYTFPNLTGLSSLLISHFIMCVILLALIYLIEVNKYIDILRHYLLREWLSSMNNKLLLNLIEMFKFLTIPTVI